MVFHILNQFLDNKFPKTVFNNLGKALKQIIINDINTITNRFNDTFHLLRCGLGTITCSINYQGDIFTCQEQDSKKTGSYFYIGNIYDGINENLHKKFLQDYINSEGKCEKPDECETCLIQKICEHGCVSQQKDLFGDMGITAYISCKNSQFAINLSRVLMTILTEQNNLKFEEYIESIYKNILYRKKVKINGK